MGHCQSDLVITNTFPVTVMCQLYDNETGAPGSRLEDFGRLVLKSKQSRVVQNKISKSIALGHSFWLLVWRHSPGEGSSTKLAAPKAKILIDKQITDVIKLKEETAKQILRNQRKMHSSAMHLSMLTLNESVMDKVGPKGKKRRPINLVTKREDGDVSSSEDEHEEADTFHRYVDSLLVTDFGMMQNVSIWLQALYEPRPKYNEFLFNQGDEVSVLIDSKKSHRTWAHGKIVAMSSGNTCTVRVEVDDPSLRKPKGRGSTSSGASTPSHHPLSNISAHHGPSPRPGSTRGFRASRLKKKKRVSFSIGEEEGEGERGGEGKLGGVRDSAGESPTMVVRDNDGNSAPAPAPLITLRKTLMATERESPSPANGDSAASPAFRDMMSPGSHRSETKYQAGMSVVQHVATDVFGDEEDVYDNEEKTVEFHDVPTDPRFLRHSDMKLGSILPDQSSRFVNKWVRAYLRPISYYWRRMWHCHFALIAAAYDDNPDVEMEYFIDDFREQLPRLHMKYESSFEKYVENRVNWKRLGPKGYRRILDTDEELKRKLWKVCGQDVILPPGLSQFDYAVIGHMELLEQPFLLVFHAEDEENRRYGFTLDEEKKIEMILEYNGGRHLVDGDGASVLDDEAENPEKEETRSETVRRTDSHQSSLPMSRTEDATKTTAPNPNPNPNPRPTSPLSWMIVDAKLPKQKKEAKWSRGVRVFKLINQQGVAKIGTLSRNDLVCLQAEIRKIFRACDGVEIHKEKLIQDHFGFRSCKLHVWSDREGSRVKITTSPKKAGEICTLSYFHRYFDVGFRWELINIYQSQGERSKVRAHWVMGPGIPSNKRAVDRGPSTTPRAGSWFA